MLLKIEGYFNMTKRFHLVYNPEHRLTRRHISHAENVLLFKISFIIGQFPLFFASEEEKKLYKKF